MKFCDHCLAPLSQSDTHCPECKLPVTSGTDDPLLIAEEERLVNPRLAHANLLRMRGKWDEAVRACAEVLRQFPNNVHAHALMGDIYRDQGSLEEAAQWYKLALDLAPDSAVDRRRLERVQHELELRQQAHNQSQEVQYLQRQTRFLRVFSATVLGLAVIVAIGITWAFQGRIPQTPGPLNITTSRLPIEAAATPTLSPPAKMEENTAPVPSESQPTVRPKDEAPVRTEDDLLADKVKAWMRSHRLEPTLLTITTDPLANHLLITFGYSADMDRDTLYRTAWLSAAAVFALHSDVHSVRVRCLVPVVVPGGERVMVTWLVADILRKQMPRQPEGTPAADIPQFLQNTWFNPNVGIASGGQ